ncbi:WhiB family transcriptional regulator [Nonomuraea jabiensis]|uniref:WhiB family transcriptional regulator n=1 Tax=Nonomuraea jabiensis TaxID=882448 RepID=UPI00343CFCB1
MTHGSKIDGPAAGLSSLADLRNELLNAGPQCTPADAELFTGPDDDAESDAARHEREAQAKAFCRQCPAWAVCLSYALAVRPDSGVWAGLTADELHGLRVRLEVA